MWFIVKYNVFSRRMEATITKPSTKTRLHQGRTSMRCRRNVAFVDEFGDESASPEAKSRILLIIEKFHPTLTPTIQRGEVVRLC